MIRKMTEADIPVLLAYGEHFWKQTPYVSTGMELDIEHIRGLLMVLKEDHYMRVYEIDGSIVGFLGIFIAPFLFNPTYSTATELFFFVHPDHRGTVGKELMAQAEQDLKDDADILAFGELRSSKDMTEYYTGLGYVHSETTFVKVI